MTKREIGGAPGTRLVQSIDLENFGLSTGPGLSACRSTYGFPFVILRTSEGVKESWASYDSGVDSEELLVTHFARELRFRAEPKRRSDSD
jgi:hypothetical protein